MLNQNLRRARPFRLILLACLVCLSAPAWAWPDKPVRLIVGYSAGGAADIIMRSLADKMRPQLGVQVIIDNKPGDSGLNGVRALQAATDGHTFMVFADDLLPLAYASKRASFDPMADFTPISVVAEGTTLLVAGPAAPFATFDEFVKFARANPGMSIVTPGTASQPHFISEYISRALKLGLKHVDTRGGSVSLNDLLDGVHRVAMLDGSLVLRPVREGKIKPLAATTPQRFVKLPDVPTLAELGLGDIPMYQRGGIVGPKGTPQEVVLRLSSAVAEAMKDETVRRYLDNLGLVAKSSTPEDYARELRLSSGRWKKFIDEQNLRID